MTPWQLDPTHSSIQFSVRHMMVSNVRGSFRKFSLEVDFDSAHPELGHVEAAVQAASIDTGMDQRDAHLRSGDFLDAEKFPILSFTSTGVESRGPGEFGLHGDLTIRGEVHPVTFDVEYIGEAVNLQGGHSAGFTARTKLSRRAWGLVWNVGLEAGGFLVGDEIKVEIDLELVQAVPEKMATPEKVPATAS
jgi:polyisoprenoid-binding protein YceI